MPKAVKEVKKETSTTDKEFRKEVLKRQAKQKIDSLDMDSEALKEALNYLDSSGITPEERDTNGFRAYCQLCEHLKVPRGYVVFNGDLKMIKVTSDEFDYSVRATSLGEKILKSIFNNNMSKIQDIYRYATLNYHMNSRDPVINKKAYLTIENRTAPDGFSWRTDLEKFHKKHDDLKVNSELVRISFDHATGRVNVMVPIIKVIKEHNDLIDEFYEVLFGYQAIYMKQYTSLYAFENRYGKSRPTLFLIGKRGSGKGLFVEKFMAHIFHNMSCKITHNPNYNTYLENKIAYIDENSDSKRDLKGLNDALKEMSGGGINTISKKYVGDYNVVNGVFPMLMSNEAKPIHISDTVTDPSQNQYLVIEMPANKLKISKLYALKSKIAELGYDDFEEFFKDTLGSYIWDKLLPIYTEMKRDLKTKSYRYGMPVPLTPALSRIQNMSVSDKEEGVYEIIADLYEGRYDGYIDEQSPMKEMFERFHNQKKKGALPTCVIPYLLSKKQISRKMFLEVLIKKDWLISKAVTQVDSFGTLKACLFLDFKKIKAFMTDTEEVIFRVSDFDDAEYESTEKTDDELEEDIPDEKDYSDADKMADGKFKVTTPLSDKEREDAAQLDQLAKLL